MSLLDPNADMPIINGTDTDPLDTTNGFQKTADMAQPNERFVLRQKGEFYYDSCAYPALPSPHHVIVRVIATGICGSDVHYWQHGEINSFKVTAPLVLGHESAGIIQITGLAVTTLRPGDRVALEPGHPCHTCRLCLSGRYNLCSSMAFAATPPHNGTLSTFYALPASFCFPLPPNITLGEGALVEPLAVAVHIAKLASTTAGSSVVVFGAGPIGLLCCAVARAFGATTIVAVDVLPARLAFAQAYAATHTALMQPQQADPQEQAHAILAAADLLDGGGADIAIDASGAEACIQCAIHALSRGGTFVQAGLGKTNITFPVGELAAKELVCKGSFRYGAGDYELAIKLLEAGRVSVKELITHEFCWGEAERAFENVNERRGIKSVIYGPGVSVRAAKAEASVSASL